MDVKKKINFVKVRKTYCNKKDDGYSIMVYLNDSDVVYLDSKYLKLLFAQADFYEKKEVKK